MLKFFSTIVLLSVSVFLFLSIPKIENDGSTHETKPLSKNNTTNTNSSKDWIHFPFKTEKDNNSSELQTEPLASKNMTRVNSSSNNNKDSDNITMDDDNVIYSLLRKDRSGSKITDMLMAHSYAYSQNKTYGGACQRRPGQKGPVGQIKALGLQDVLPIQCPSNRSSPSLLSADVYRQGSRLFTKEWRQSLVGKQQLPRPQSQSAASKDETDRTLQVVVHVRRGDVNPCRPRNRIYRYLPNQHYLTLLDRYLSVDKNYAVTIYSESKSHESFDVFQERNYTVELDTKLGEVWPAMMTADILIMSVSFFSVVPAILNPNTVVYTPCFFEAPFDWEVVDQAILNKTEAVKRKMLQEECR